MRVQPNQGTLQKEEVEVLNRGDETFFLSSGRRLQSPVVLTEASLLVSSGDPVSLVLL